MMKRREFIGLLGGAAASPLTGVAGAQQTPTPVIGYLGAGTARSSAYLVSILNQSLSAAGYIEGRNLTIEYRWAEGQYERLPALMGDLARRQVAAIVATPTTAALAAKAGTSTVPIVFVSTDDPVKAGLVASLARPGGNVTGVYFFLSDLGAKQLGLLRELLPSAVRIGHLINPGNPNVAFATKDVIAAASTLGVEVMPVEAGDVPGIEIAFKSLVAKKAEGLVVAADPLFFSRRLQLATLATRHGIPAIYNVREFAEAGGLMSYGTSLAEAFRQAATYATRILKGEKPTDLPVVQATKFELAINLPTARALGLEIPPTLLARADEVIE